jgi:hypothetical protein
MAKLRPRHLRPSLGEQMKSARERLDDLHPTARTVAVGRGSRPANSRILLGGGKEKQSRHTPVLCCAVLCPCVTLL